jgi:tetratricopeptide (TPR) repeat protein
LAKDKKSSTPVKDKAAVNHEPQRWPVTGLIDHFMRVETQRPDRSFCFLLGAGASKSSGIRTGGELVQEWLRELERLDLLADHLPPLDEWATEANLDIKAFEYPNAAAFYPQVYDRRFGDRPQDGFAYLEDVMKDAEPGLGYSILAQVLDQTRHKVVITTNFDNLVADALSIFTRVFPLVCGHESLTPYARLQLRRPLIAKIHRDLLYAPRSGIKDTSKLHRNWCTVLKRMLSLYTPIVIGYGGNDGSLMDFLDELKAGDMTDGLFWCYREQDGLPIDRIRRLVAKHNGAIVPILGFDEFMLQMNQRLGYPLQHKQIQERAELRAQTYRDSVELVQFKLKRASRQLDPMSERKQSVDGALDALHSAVNKQGDTWWAWNLRASRTQDPEEGERIYREALDRFPDHPKLIVNFAIFLYMIRKNYDEPDGLYQRAIQLDPNNAGTVCNYAIYKEDIDKDYNEAERLYRLALELDGNDADTYGRLALFMECVRKEYDEAERLYGEALKLDTDDVSHIRNYAQFLEIIRKDYEGAACLYQRALQLDPEDADTIGNYAAFLLTQGRTEEADVKAGEAWNLHKGEDDHLTAEVALYRGLILATNGNDDTPALARLRELLQKGYKRDIGTFDEQLEVLRDKLAEEQYQLYHAIKEAINDESHLAALEQIPAWQAIEPISLDEPWP